MLIPHSHAHLIVAINKRKLHLPNTFNIRNIYMEIFNSLTLIKLGSIAFALTLALFTYRLLKKEQKNENSNKSIVRYALLLLGFILATSVFIIVTNISHSNFLGITFSGNTIQLFNANSPSNNINSDEYFHNSDIGFSILKPQKNWSRIKRGSGLIDFLKMSGLKQEEVTSEKLAEYNNDPFLQVFNFVTFFSFNQKEEHLELKFTDSTEVRYLKPYQENYYKQTLEALNREYSNNLKQNMIWADSLTQMAMHAILANLNIDFSAKLKLIAFPKNTFDSGLSGLSLAGFYNVYSSSFGMNVSEIVANKTGILMGVNSLLENVLINNIPQDLEINRYTHFSESEDYFFILEISHSPQSGKNNKQWNELSNVMESFRAL